MKSTGIVRCVDELGRIVVPKEMRQKMGIENGDPVEIFADGDRIILEKYRSLCHFCSSDEDIVEFYGKNICRKCIEELRGVQ
ncbi:MAG: AbrB/MazE/SpoVT family DNA-binding domain-containing protein [Clostridia bacterium]|nr:AbrB/MazE/SpoVT family DNA-binding domain-containing protein [Clostridia bacterium]MBQ7363949.1 AbrB/MazE/SpoVT family DNA-binding domain-containing protein [Clostridia bacterium]